MTTTANLVDETKRHLLAGQPETLNKLAAGTAPGTGSLTFVYDLDGIQAGSLVQIDLEVFYVWEVNDSSKSAVVQPAYLGSLAAAHDTGDLVTVNPKFPDHQIIKALNDDLLDLSSPQAGLYQFKSADLTWVDTAGGYDLTGVTGLLSIAEVRAQRGGTGSKDWSLLNNYDLSRDVNATLFPSGLALFFSDPGEVGGSVRVRYRAEFGQLATLGDDVTAVTGLPASAHDIPPLGAAARLMRARELRRNFTDSQGDTRRAGEVPPGAVRRSADGLWGDRQRRIAAESARLSQFHPVQGYIPSSSAYAVFTAAGRDWY